MSQMNASPEGKPKARARGNRRATVRYRCAPATVGKVFSANDHEFQRAWIQDLSLTGLGMDSLMGLELRNRIEAGLGVRAPATLLWTYSTVTALSSRLGAMLGQASAVPTPPAADFDPLKDVPEDRDQLLSLLDEELSLLGVGGSS